MIFNLLHTLFYFGVALLLLVGIHELGHFIVARLCNVKVLRVSFGFGKVLASLKGKHGTEYAFSAIPLGGYVKMLDETEAPVSPSDKPFAFNNQSVYKRIAIVLAGPLFNFLCAFLLCWLILIIGVESIAPIIGNVKPDSIGAEIGFKPQQEILKINQKNMTGWPTIQAELYRLSHQSSPAPASITVSNPTTNTTETLELPAEVLIGMKAHPDVLKQLGIDVFMPNIPAKIKTVLRDSPGAIAGLMPGDIIDNINGQPVKDWITFVNYVKAHPHTTVDLTLLRDQSLKHVSVNITSKSESNNEGYIGLQVDHIQWPEEYIRIYKESPFTALINAGHQTYALIFGTFNMIRALVLGKLDSKQLSGPIGIAQGAGESAKEGVAHYLFFLALLSISLGVLNLLPIPALDGGHLLFYLIEIIKGKPVSDRTKAVGIYIGLFLFLMLTMIALSNDLKHIFYG